MDAKYYVAIGEIHKPDRHQHSRLQYHHRRLCIKGPYTEQQIGEMFYAGQITADTMIWEKGTPSWVKLETLLPENPPPLSASQSESVETQKTSNELKADKEYQEWFQHGLPPLVKPQPTQKEEDVAETGGTGDENHEGGVRFWPPMKYIP